MSQEEESFDKASKNILIKLVSSALADKPRDPVPYIYSYLLELSKNKEEPKPITDQELAEIRNLSKKVEYLKSQLVEDTGDEEHSASEDEEDDDVDEIKPKKKGVKAPRAGVSAEVYGDWNKKGDFVPKVV